MRFPARPDSVGYLLNFMRNVAPAIDNNAADDQYNEFAPTEVSSDHGRTGPAWNDPTGSDMLAFGPTQSNGAVVTYPVAGFDGCNFPSPGTIDPKLKREARRSAAGFSTPWGHARLLKR